MVSKLCDLRATLDVPEDAGHVTGGCEDSSVVDEPAATEVSGVPGEFPSNTGRAFPSREVVDGADVVKTTAGDEIAAGGVGAGHDPGGAQGDGVHLVGRVGVPDDELAVLRCGDQVPPVGGPVHSVDLGQMAFEGALRLHG